MKVIEVIRHAAGKIVRMHALSPAFPYFLIEGPARKGEPGVIEVIAVRVEARAPDQDRRMLHQQAVLRGRQR